MEIRARYFLIGLFVLVVIAGGGGFLYWLWGFGGLTQKTAYAVRFDGPVSGLSAGSEVLFNGITIGEVTGLSLDPRLPSNVVVTIAVDSRVPVRSDTVAGLAFSGLTGAASIALVGGSAASPPLPPGNPPLIVADDQAREDLTSAARDTLNQIDGVISDNAEALHSAITSIATFSDALARNSSKIDAIVNGISSLTGGGAPMNYALHDLTAPTVSKPAALPMGQLVVTRPTSLVALSTQRVLLDVGGGDAPVFDDVRWGDTLPILVQARLIETMENAGDVRVVSDAGAATGDFQLVLDLRAFHMVSLPTPTAQVSIAAKLFDNADKVIDAKTFSDTEPLAKLDDSSVGIAGLNDAFGKVAADITTWTFATMLTAEANTPATPAPAPTDAGNASAVTAPPLAPDAFPPFPPVPGAPAQTPSAPAKANP